MKRTLLLILVGIVCCAVLLFAFRLRHPLITRAQEPDAEPGTPLWYAQQAVANGLTQASYAIFPHYAGTDDLDSAVAQYPVIVAHPISKESSVTPEGDQIVTWYKFVLDETLASRSFVSCDDCDAPDEPPGSLLPLNPGEILIETNEGSTYLDGVALSVSDGSFIGFGLNQRYLLFLNLNPANQVGQLTMGPAESALAVGSDNRFYTVVTFEPGEDEPISTGLANEYSNSLTNLRAALNPSGPPSCDPVQEQNCYNRGGDWDGASCTCYVDPCIRKPWLCP